MRKLIAYIVLGILLFIYIVSMKTTFMNKVSDYINVEDISILKSDKYRYGDLYGLSYLPDYKFLFTPYQIETFSKGNNNKNLYIIGDSYVHHGKIHTNNFKNIDTLILADWRTGSIPYKLDTTQTNILIIESTERFFLNRFIDSTRLFYALDNQESELVPEKTFATKLESFISTKEINDHLEYLLFDYAMFTPFKELKANINYKCFDRLPANICLSDDKKYLMLGETIDTSLLTSSFKYIDSKTLANVIVNCNKYINFYLSKGFDKVYLSIIPSYASIIGYRNYQYNNLIPLINCNPNRNFDVIDIYDDFNASDKQLYHYSDTHWNSAGLQIWVDKVNERL
jgi:hypothetical protein